MTRLLRFALAWALLATSLNAAAVQRTTANLPYRFPQVDPFGNMWMLYNGGRLMQQGNMPFCSESAMLSINGQGFNSPGQTVTIENGEAILENLRGGAFTITRRFLQQDDGVIRIIDSIRNTRGQDAVANTTISFNVNFGIQSSRQLTDPRKADKTLANLITDGQNRSLLSVFAGKGAKVTPSINAPQNNNLVQATFDLKVPANREVSIVHFHQILANPDQADKSFAALRETRSLAGLSPELRKSIANFAVSSSSFEDLEILRGTTTDVLELANGDQLRGDLLTTAWETETSFGKVQIPADQVIGMLTAGGLRPRQLIITRDGEIIGGKLLTPAIDLQISTGQKISVPVAQVSRMGRRTSGDESATAPAAKPMLHLRTGDRLAIKLPTQPLRVVTRFGTLELPAEMIATIDLQPEQSPVHVIALTDGSRFSGLLLPDSLQLSLARGGDLTIATAMVRKMTFAPETEDEPQATLRLTGDDALAAALPQKLGLVTNYGEVTVNGAEVKRITRVKDTLEDVQIQLWDDSTITGRLPQPFIECMLGGKAVARVPVGAIELYTCAAPQPAAGIVERIKKLVTELNADDWKQRERAEADLLSMGNGILPTLNQLRAGQPPEAQQRMDSIIRRLTKPDKPASPGGVAPGTMEPMFLR